jgi:hypothetical protein
MQQLMESGRPLLLRGLRLHARIVLFVPSSAPVHECRWLAHRQFICTYTEQQFGGMVACMHYKW